VELGLLHPSDELWEGHQVDDDAEQLGRVSEKRRKEWQLMGNGSPMVCAWVCVCGVCKVCGYVLCVRCVCVVCVCGVWCVCVCGVCVCVCGACVVCVWCVVGCLV